MTDKTEQVDNTTETVQATALTSTDSAKTVVQPTPENEQRTFTQADLDNILKDRLARESQKTREKYADYDTLKASAARLAEIEEANKTEEQKRDDALAKVRAESEALKSENARLAQERTSALIKSAVITKAKDMHFLGIDEAYLNLASQNLVLADDGTIEDLEGKLEALGKAKPYLLEQQPKLSATNPGRTSEEGESDQARRARLFGIGNVPFGQHGGGMMQND